MSRRDVDYNIRTPGLKAARAAIQAADKDVDALTRSVKAGEEAWRDAAGRLRNASGQFVRTGNAAAEAGDKAAAGGKRGAAGVLELEAAASLVKRGFDLLRKAGEALAVPVDAATGYERQFNQIRQLSDQVGADTQRALLDLAGRVPQTVGDIMQAGYQAVSGGVGVDVLPDFLGSASDLARLANTELTPTVDLLGASLNAYKAQGLGAAEATDILVQTVNKGKTTIPELASSLGQVTSVAASAGISFTELGASIATITRVQGGNTAEAVTQVRALINILRNPPVRTIPVLKRIGASFGVAALESKGLVGVLRDMQAAAERNNVDLGALFKSVEAGQAILKLSGENAGEFAQSLKDLGDSAGSAERGLSKVKGDAQDLRDQLSATVDALLVEMGQEALPALKDALSDVLGVIRDNKGDIIEAFGAVIRGIVGVGEWVAEYGDDVLLFAATFFAVGRVQAFATAVSTQVIPAISRLGTAFSSVANAGSWGAGLSAALSSPGMVAAAVAGAAVLGRAVGVTIADVMSREVYERGEKDLRETEARLSRLDAILRAKGYKGGQADLEAEEKRIRGGDVLGYGTAPGSDGRGASVAARFEALRKDLGDDRVALTRLAADVGADVTARTRAIDALIAQQADTDAKIRKLTDRVGPYGDRDIRGALGDYIDQGREDLAAAKAQASAIGTQLLDAQTAADRIARDFDGIRRGKSRKPAGKRSGADVVADGKAADAAKRKAEAERRKAEAERERLARLEEQFAADLARRRIVLIADEGERRIAEMNAAHIEQLFSEAANGDALLNLLVVQNAERTALERQIAKDRLERERADRETRAGFLADRFDRDIEIARINGERQAAIARQVGASVVEVERRTAEEVRRLGREKTAARYLELAAYTEIGRSIGDVAIASAEAVGVGARIVAGIKIPVLGAAAVEEGLFRAPAAFAVGNIAGGFQHLAAAAGAVKALRENIKIAGGGGGAAGAGSAAASGGGRGGARGFDERDRGRVIGAGGGGRGGEVAERTVYITNTTYNAPVLGTPRREAARFRAVRRTADRLPGGARIPRGGQGV